MDNNFNGQGSNENNTSNMFNNQGNLFGDVSGNNVQSSHIDYNMGVVKQKPNMIMGIIGALIGAVIGAVVWILISKTGYIFGILGMGIMWLTMFLYERMAKGMNIAGTIICIALTFIAIYIGNRVGAVLVVQSEYAKNAMDISFSRSNELFKLHLEIDSEFKSAYIQDLITSYVFSIVCSIALVAGYIRKKK